MPLPIINLRVVSPAKVQVVLIDDSDEEAQHKPGPKSKSRPEFASSLEAGYHVCRLLWVEPCSAAINLNDVSWVVMQAPCFKRLEHQLSTCEKAADCEMRETLGRTVFIVRMTL